MRVLFNFLSLSFQQHFYAYHTSCTIALFDLLCHRSISYVLLGHFLLRGKPSFTFQAVACGEII